MSADLARRGFLAAAAVTLCAPNIVRSAVPSPSKARVVVLGGGFAGARAARRLKQYLPDARIRLIEENAFFVPGYSVLPFLFGDAPVSSLRQDYNGLSKLGIEMVRARALGVDPGAGVVETTQGREPYDHLIIATGTRYALDGINGLDEAPEHNSSPFDRSRVESTREKIRAFSQGTAVICISAGSTMCPPAPYEFALLLAQHLARNNHPGNVVVLDANLSPQPLPLSTQFKHQIAALDGRLEYIPAAGDVVSVDTRARQVVTSNDEEMEYAFLSIFPPGAVAPWVNELGASIQGDRYIEVDPLSLRTRRYPNIHALGDVARVPYGKSAFAATVCAERCAKSVAQSLGAVLPKDTDEVKVACFPHIGADQAMAMKVAYRFDGGDGEDRHLVSHAEIDLPSAETLAYRYRWERENLLQTFF